MISRLSLICFFLLISFSCEKGDRVVITGIVTDEVTGNPVSGASVSLKLHYQYDGMYYSTIINGTTTTTASNGSYKIVYDRDHPAIGAMNIPKPFPKSYNVYASAPDLAGSDLHPLLDEKLQNVDIKLYHYAQLALHVKNDGRYKLKDGCIWLDRGGLSYAPFSTTEFHFICKGQNFDSTFIINHLWGNFNYSYGVTKGGYDFYSMWDTVLSGSIIAKPNSITDFSITF